MALEDQVAALVTSTTALTTAVNVQKATLDTAVTNASTSATNAAASATTATNQATTAGISATTATNQATAAATSATNAATSATNATTAATASGNVVFYGTKALADAALAGLAANQVVRVFSDETKGYVSTWYQKVSGSYVFMLADVRPGTDPELSPANYMLGTCAYINQTWRDTSVTYSPGAIANNAEVQTTVTLPGAQLGDFVLATSSVDSQGILIDARVSAPDTVKVHYRNMSGASITLASHTLYVRLMARIPE